jgi:hypothetical protein
MLLIAFQSRLAVIPFGAVRTGMPFFLAIRRRMEFHTNLSTERIDIGFGFVPLLEQSSYLIVS